MAHSVCGKCGNTTWKLEEQAPQNSRFKMWFVQCSKCNVPVAAVDFWPVGSLVKQIADKLGI